MLGQHGPKARGHGAVLDITSARRHLQTGRLEVALGERNPHACSLKRVIGSMFHSVIGRLAGDFTPTSYSSSRPHRRVSDCTYRKTSTSI